METGVFVEKGPQQGSASDQIIRTIYELGPLTIEDLMRVAGSLHAWRTGYVSTLRRCVEYGWLELCSGRRYALTLRMLDLIDGAQPPAKYEGEAAGPRYHKEFTPIQAKNIPSLEPRRPDALPARRVSFISCSSEYRVLG